jgi:hypothetical protein
VIVMAAQCGLCQTRKKQRAPRPKPTVHFTNEDVSSSWDFLDNRLTNSYAPTRIAPFPPSNIIRKPMPFANPFTPSFARVSLTTSEMLWPVTCTRVLTTSRGFTIAALMVPETAGGCQTWRYGTNTQKRVQTTTLPMPHAISANL